MINEIVIPVDDIDANDLKFMFYAHITCDKKFFIPESPGKGLLDLSRHKDPEKAKKELRNIRDKQLVMHALLKVTKSQYDEVMRSIELYMGTDSIEELLHTESMGRCTFTLDLPPDNDLE